MYINPYVRAEGIYAMSTTSSPPWATGKGVGLLSRLHTSSYPSLVPFLFWKLPLVLFHLLRGLGGGELGLSCVHGEIGLLASLRCLRP